MFYDVRRGLLLISHVENIDRQLHSCLNSSSDTTPSIVYSILHIVNHRLHSCSILETRNAGGSSKSRSFAAAMKNTFGLLYVRVCVNQRILSAERRGCYTLTVATQVVRWRMVQARISNPSICRHLGLSSYHVIKLSICLVAANNVMESE